jgi:LmbE family N-acetylglucosaminyl deacetylase
VTTIVFCHAHPDDEASQTSGAMARAADQGDRVVVVFATHGEHGEVAADLGEHETVADYRRREAENSAKVLGLARIVWLGYSDSGMSGWEQNDAEGSFHAADLGEAARRLAGVLDEEDADVVTGYDWHGGYGHPDHVKVHHLVHAAVPLARRTPRLLESTFNRSDMRRQLAEAREMGIDIGDWDPDAPMDDGNPLGSEQEDITWEVDVSAYIAQKRLALEAHRSQATDIEQFLAMPPEVFGRAFGLEHYIEPGLDQPMQRGWPFIPPAG